MLAKLGHLTGETAYLDKLEEMYATFYDDVRQGTAASTHFIQSLLLSENPSKEVVIIGEQDAFTADLQQAFCLMWPCWRGMTLKRWPKQHRSHPATGRWTAVRRFTSAKISLATSRQPMWKQRGHSFGVIADRNEGTGLNGFRYRQDIVT